MVRFSFIVLSFSVLLMYTSCDTDTVDSQPNFNDLFVNTSDNIIIPRYAKLQAEIINLSGALEAFDGTEVKLSNLQNQFIETYHAWQRVSVFQFGPAAEFSALLRENCNTFPANPILIEANISLENYSLDLPSNYEAKGFSALDYLFFHAHKNELLVELSNPLRLAYAKDCVDDMRSRISGVVTSWDSYRTTFLAAEGNDRNSSLSLLFNQFRFDYEQIKRNKLALPSGFATQYGIPLDADTALVEGLYSKQSFALIATNLQALQNIYLGIGEDGIDGVGMYEKLKEYNAQSTVVEGDLAQAIQDQFEVCKTLIAGFSNDLPFEIQSNIAQIQLVSNEFQKMVPMLKNDMRSYLSVTVTLTDSDGD